MPLPSWTWPLKRWRRGLLAYLAEIEDRLDTIDAAIFPDAPSGLVASAVSGTQINLTWDDNSDNETGFRLERSPNGTDSWSTVTTTSADDEDHSDTGLTQSTTYYYRVIAEGSVGDSAPSNVANATTLASGDVPLLLHMDGSDTSTTFTDSGDDTLTMTAAGAAQLDTAQQQFGTASGLFDGSNSYVTTTYNTTNFDWWTQEWMAECWVRADGSWNNWFYFSGGFNIPAMFGNAVHNSLTNYWSFGPSSSGSLAFYYYNGSSNNVLSAVGLSVDTWHSIAASHVSGSLRLFANGSLLTTHSVSGTPQSSGATPLTLGKINNRTIDGWVDELRITTGTGVARTASYTPSGPFPNP